MGIFKKRPLCLFCTLFLIVTLFSWQISTKYMPAILFVFALLALSFIIINKGRARLMILCISLVVIFATLLHSYLFVKLPTEKAKEHIGMSKVHCYIIDDEYVSEYSEQYCVKIINVDGEDTNIRATLVCDFPAELSAGDEIYGIGEISDMISDGDRSDGRILRVYMSSPKTSFYRNTSDGKGIVDHLFSDSGIEILSNKFSDAVRGVLYNALGDRLGALALGFFTGERSDMPIDITRDFRRSGLSHLMAVSGSHITILLGGLELILRKLYMPKSARIAVVSLFGILFIFITGFSLSGCRSVFMLYAVYLGYIMSEEADPLTSLFVSVSLIILFFPYASLSLSLWMSFFSTLGLLCAYPVFEKMLIYPEKKNKFYRFFIFTLRSMATVALMTVVANAFLLPIIWWFFGEFSLVSIFVNILAAPLSTIFLIIVPILTVFAGVPLLSDALIFVTKFIGQLILYIVKLCSMIPYATVSLKYGFCAVIVVLFTISMIVLLIVELKKKYLIAIPTVAAVLSFVVCFSVYNIFFMKPSLTHLTDEGSNEMYVVKEGSDISFCDNTSGSARYHSYIIFEMKNSTATEIDSYILTRYTHSHVSLFETVLRNNIVRTVYMPEPLNNYDIKYSKAIFEMAKKANVKICFYKENEKINICNSVSAVVDVSDTDITVDFSSKKENGQYIKKKI